METASAQTIALAKQTLSLALETAPWLLLGLIVAGLLKAYLPDYLLSRWIGGRSTGAIGRAAIFGAPLPLCSCGVIPAAIGLRRQGASPGSTVSFLVATPETGVDSVAVSYVLLGPVLTIVRPIAAVISAIISGITCQLVADRTRPYPGPIGGGAPRDEAPTLTLDVTDDTCCQGSSTAEETDACCDDATSTDQAANRQSDAPRGPVALEKLRAGLRYAASDLMDEIWLWMLIGLVAAAAVNVFIGQQTLATWGSGLPAMLLMLVVGIPMYICATASTPLAAAMLLAGVSPGTVLVFLLAGPATNLATVGLVRRELGTPVVIAYLVAMAGSALALGLATDAIITAWHIDILAQQSQTGRLIPFWLAWAALVALVLIAIRPLRRAVL